MLLISLTKLLYSLIPIDKIELSYSLITLLVLPNIALGSVIYELISLISIAVGIGNFIFGYLCSKYFTLLLIDIHFSLDLKIILGIILCLSFLNIKYLCKSE